MIIKNFYKYILLCGFLVIPITTYAEDLCNISKFALEAAQRERGLKIKKRVPCKVQNKEEVRKYILSAIEKGLTEEKLRNEEKLFKTLGLIPKSFSYKTGIIDLYLSQLGGYYDPIDEYFVMAGWLPAIMQQPIAVHELTHALQDQYYNLDDFLNHDDVTTDQALARSALAEGDATLVMYNYVNKLSGQSDLAKEDSVDKYVLQAVAGAKMTAGLNTAPQSLQAMLLFPYTSGLRFAHALLKKGGYKEIDRAFKKLPQTTSEILHPELYLSKKNSRQELKLEDFYEEELAEVIYTDTLGEFAITAMFSMFPNYQNKSSELAQGWLADKAFITETGTVYWLSTWQNEENAKKFYQAVKGIYPQAQVELKNNNIAIYFSPDKK